MRRILTYVAVIICGTAAVLLFFHLFLRPHPLLDDETKSMIHTQELMLIAQQQSTSGDYQHAVASYRQALSGLESSKHPAPASLAIVHFEIGKIDVQQHGADGDEGVRYLQQSEQEFKQVGDVTLSTQAHDLLKKYLSSLSETERQAYCTKYHISP